MAANARAGQRSSVGEPNEDSQRIPALIALGWETLGGKEVLEICPVEKGTLHRLPPLGGCGVARCEVTCYDVIMSVAKPGYVEYNV